MKNQDSYLFRALRAFIYTVPNSRSCKREGVCLLAKSYEPIELKRA